MADCVLDASAVMAKLRDERGAEAVLGGTGALLSAINYAEIVSKLIDLGLPASVATEGVAELELTIVPFEETDALRVGALRDRTRRFGLSLGDRACLALAEAAGLPVLTADRAWADLDLGVEVVLIR